MIEMTFLSNQSKGTNITENSFALQNEPDTAKLSFSAVLNFFSSKFTKILSLTAKKWKEVRNYSESFFSPNRFKNELILKKG